MCIRDRNPIGTRVNPADPRIGITLDTTGGTVYFKLTETLKGQEAENRLLQINQSLEEIKQGEYEHTGTTLVLFVYDVQAVNGLSLIHISLFMTMWVWIFPDSL